MLTLITVMYLIYMITKTYKDGKHQVADWVYEESERRKQKQE